MLDSKHHVLPAPEYEIDNTGGLILPAYIVKMMMQNKTSSFLSKGDPAKLKVILLSGFNSGKTCSLEYCCMTVSVLQVRMLLPVLTFYVLKKIIDFIECRHKIRIPPSAKRHMVSLKSLFALNVFKACTGLLYFLFFTQEELYEELM